MEDNKLGGQFTSENKIWVKKKSNIDPKKFKEDTKNLPSDFKSELSQRASTLKNDFGLNPKDDGGQFTK